MRDAPLKIEIVLFFHCRPKGQVPSFSTTSPVYRQFTTELIAEGILERTPEGDWYTTTDKGKAYVDGLCELGYPQQKWSY